MTREQQPHKQLALEQTPQPIAPPVVAADVIQAIADFKAKFVMDEDSRVRLTAQAWTNKQRKDQSVDSYIDQVVTQGTRGGFSDDHKRYCIRNGFRSYIRRALTGKDLATVDDIRKAARAIETMEKESDDENDSPKLLASEVKKLMVELKGSQSRPVEACAATPDIGKDGPLPSDNQNAQRNQWPQRGQNSQRGQNWQRGQYPQRGQNGQRGRGWRNNQNGGWTERPNRENQVQFDQNQTYRPQQPWQLPTVRHVEATNDQTTVAATNSQTTEVAPNQLTTAATTNNQATAEASSTLHSDKALRRGPRSCHKHAAGVAGRLTNREKPVGPCRRNATSAARLVISPTNVALHRASGVQVVSSGVRDLGMKRKT